MKLDNKDKLYLNIENFINKVTEEFLNIEDVSLMFYAIKNEYGEKQYFFNKNKELIPLKVTIIHNGYVSRYKFTEINPCDDEYALTTKLGEHVGYYDFRKFILDNLGDVLVKKNFEEEMNYNSDNINNICENTYRKIKLIELSENLPEKNTFKKNKTKI